MPSIPPPNKRALRIAVRVRALVVLTITLALGVVSSAPDLDKIQSVALQRYGAKGSDLVIAWRAMMAEGSRLSEAEKLAQVNNFFNRRMLFESDSVIWQ